MKLTTEEKNHLAKMAVKDEDIAQIEAAANVTKYTLCDRHGNDIRNLTRASVIRCIGRDRWLDGLVRSAFHWTCVMSFGEDESIYFDSKKLFR